MPISESSIRELGSLGHAPICSEATQCIYALYPGDEDGSPHVSWDKFTYGTAFAASADGLFITATHVLNDIEEAANGRSYNLCLIRDRTTFGHPVARITDVNIVKEFDRELQDISVISGEVSNVESYDHLEVRTNGRLDSMGQPVSTFGYPVNELVEGRWMIEMRTSQGVVSRVVADSRLEMHPYYEVDRIFNPGLSGGPLISLLEGDVIGVVSEFDWWVETINWDGEDVDVPYPTHLSKAMIVTEQEQARTDTLVGDELESLGVAASEHTFHSALE